MLYYYYLILGFLILLYTIENVNSHKTNKIIFFNIIVFITVNP